MDVLTAHIYIQMQIFVHVIKFEKKKKKNVLNFGMMNGTKIKRTKKKQ